MPIREAAVKLVNLLLDDEGYVRICSACERQFGQLQLRAGQQKTHGLCKRHSIEMFGAHLPPESIRRIEQKPEENFPPDLAKSQRRAPAHAG